MGQNLGQPGPGGFGTPPAGANPFDSPLGMLGSQGAFPGASGAPSSAGPQIPAHLLAGPGQPPVPAKGSMKTWYLVCVLAMILVAAVTYIALRFMSG